MRYSSTIISLILTALTVLHTSGQTPDKPGLPTSADAALPTSPAQRMEALIAGGKALQEKAAGLRKSLASLAQDDSNRSSQEAELAETQLRIEEQEKTFTVLAAGVNAAEIRQQNGDAKLDWDAELRDAFQPVLRELKQIGERPRQLENLTTALSASQRKRSAAEKAVAQIERTLASLPAGQFAAVRNRLESDDLPRWRSLLSEEQDRSAALLQQMEAWKQDAPSLWASLWSSFKDFLFNRGRSLVLTFAAFLAVFYGLRTLRKLWQRWSPAGWQRTSPALNRMANLGWHLFVMACSVFVALAVLYASGDWVLLALALLLLAGGALAARHGLARLYGHARLLLNLGEVREGERIIIGGVPWLVKDLNLYSRLTNPVMRGDGLRMPLDALLRHMSRPHDREEPWFPCEEGHWVLLADGTFGKVTYITPEFVQIVMLGGSRVTFPTGGVLELQLRNLSSGFRVSSIFGLDYCHQKEAVEVIPEQMARHIETGLRGLIAHGHVHAVKVELQAAGSNSIDFQIIADFAGAAAEKYQVLRRAVQRLAVSACNEYGWTIAFPQMVVHSAPVTLLNNGQELNLDAPEGLAPASIFTGKAPAIAKRRGSS